MELNHDRGFILNKFSYSESDIILKVINDKGKKQTFFAKAAKKSLKRFSGGLDYFHLLNLEYSRAGSGSMGKLIATSIEVHFDTIHRDLSRFALASILLECIDHFLKEDDSEIKLFEELTSFFEKLEKSTVPLGVYCSTLIELFRILGYGLTSNSRIQNAMKNNSWKELFFLLENEILVHGQKELRSLGYAKKIIFHA